MTAITININSDSATETMLIKQAMEQIAININKDNLRKIAEISRKPGINEKFSSLLNNPLYKSFL